MGIECTVISPYSLSHRLKYKNEKIPTVRDEITPSGNKIHVYAPRYISLSSTKTSLKLTELTFKKAVFKAFKKKNIKVDAVYGHFIYPSGLSTTYIKDKLSVPAFLACGENSNKLESKDDIYFYGLDKCSWKKKLSKLNGIISVSSENKRLLIDNDFVNKNFESHIEVFPNGTNNKRFYKMDRTLILSLIHI